MKNNNSKFLSEHEIIYNYLNKLNFNKYETFNFKNDGALIKQKKNYDLVVTNDTIIQNIDFFKNDSPDSIAQKIITCNLSDLSAMGADPFSYTLSLSLPKGIDLMWLKKFINKLFFFQKKYNFYLLGGDLSNSNNIHISANFFGYVKKKLIIKRNFPKIGDTIWVTGNLGESKIGLLLKQKKLNFKKNFQNYYINQYLYPMPSMIGSKLVNFCNCGIDISDGFLGDLSKLLNKKLGAFIFSSQIPFSRNTKKLLNKKIIQFDILLNAGDDYELIFTTSPNMNQKILEIAKRNKCKISNVGRIIKKRGIFIDGKKTKNSNESFQYFF